MPHYTGTLVAVNEWKKLERAEPEQRLFFHVSPQLLGSSSPMSLLITYHSLAIDLDLPSDLQRSPGVTVGREVLVKEGGGH